MILKGSQRGGARALARHLLNEKDNDHVELHEVRGFLSEDLDGALLEAEAAAKGTKCKQHFFSVSLSPPQAENVRPEVFEHAARRIEEQVGLKGQPRAMIFHEKEGRRHAHVVWSRIDAETMRAINLPHFKRRLNEVSRDLFLEHGWELPHGFKKDRARNPLNFSLAQWQQARRAGMSASDLKAGFQECWNAAKDAKKLTKMLQERGLYLARGDRRGVVAVDFKGEIYSLSKWSGVRAKDVKSRLGDPADLPSVGETKERLSKLYTKTLKRHLDTLKRETNDKLAPLTARKQAMTTQHKADRAALDKRQSKRWAREAADRQARFRKGLHGLWDRLRGRHRHLRKRNEMEIRFKSERDRTERQNLIQKQLQDRRELQKEIQHARDHHAVQRTQLMKELARTQTLAREGEERKARRPRNRTRDRTQDRTRGTERARQHERVPEP